VASEQHLDPECAAAGLVNATASRVGDTLYAGSSAVRFPALPGFTPQHFAVAHAADLSRVKQFRKGVDQLAEVATHRMQTEFKSPFVLEHLPYSVVRLLPDHVQRFLVDTGRGSEVLVCADGAEIAVFIDRISMGTLLRQHPELNLEPLLAGTE
jgi:peptide chain release factor 3